MKNERAPGPDHLPVDIVKLVEEKYINTLENLFNSFLIIPENSNVKHCSDNA